MSPKDAKARGTDCSARETVGAVGPGSGVQRLNSGSFKHEEMNLHRGGSFARRPERGPLVADGKRERAREARGRDPRLGRLAPQDPAGGTSAVTLASRCPRAREEALSAGGRRAAKRNIRWKRKIGNAETVAQPDAPAGEVGVRPRAPRPPESGPRRTAAAPGCPCGGLGGRRHGHAVSGSARLPCVLRGGLRRQRRRTGRLRRTCC